MHTLYGRRLGNRVLDHRFLRLRRASHGDEHDGRRRARRDVAEVGRRTGARHVAPGAVQGRCIIPAPGEQDVGAVVCRVDEHIGGGVRGPEQTGAADRLEVRWALEHEQFRRHVAHVDRGHTIGERRLWRHIAAVEQIDLPALRSAVGPRRQGRTEGPWSGSRAPPPCAPSQPSYTEGLAFAPCALRADRGAREGELFPASFNLPAGTTLQHGHRPAGAGAARVVFGGPVLAAGALVTAPAPGWCERTGACEASHQRSRDAKSRAIEPGSSTCAPAC